MNQTEYEYLLNCFHAAAKGGRVAWVWLDYARVWCRLHPSPENNAAWLAAERDGPEAALALLTLVAYNSGLRLRKRMPKKTNLSGACYGIS